MSLSGIQYSTLQTCEETEDTPRGSGHIAEDGFHAEIIHHNPIVSNVFEDYFSCLVKDIPHAADNQFEGKEIYAQGELDASSCIQILGAQVYATEVKEFLTHTTRLGMAPCFDMVDVNYSLQPMQAEGSAADEGTIPGDSKGISDHPMCETPGKDCVICHCLYPPLPIEFLREADALRGARYGKGRCPRKNIGRSETSGRGTADFNAPCNRGTDFEKHMGPVPGTGAECAVVSCHDSFDSCTSTIGDTCPSKQPQFVFLETFV